MSQVLMTPLRRIQTPGGDVLHAMKVIDPGFAGFGEAYFSLVESGYVKGWKRHERMTLNFIVPHGRVQVAVVDEAAGSQENFVLGPDSSETHRRLTIPSGLWVAFGGLSDGGMSIMLNLASMPHDPTEAVSVPLARFPWSWQER